MQKLNAYIRASYVEMREKVTWPTYSQLQSSSILVLVASVIFAAFIGLIDLGFDNAMDWFYSAF